MSVMLTHLICDLDNTLYPPSRGVVERVDVLINRFMVERLGMSLDEAGSLRARYRDAHGTTLNGLMLHHEIEPNEYLEAVHAIAVEVNLLGPVRVAQVAAPETSVHRPSTHVTAEPRWPFIAGHQ